MPNRRFKECGVKKMALENLRDFRDRVRSATSRNRYDTEEFQVRAYADHDPIRAREPHASCDWKRSDMGLSPATIDNLLRNPQDFTSQFMDLIRTVKNSLHRFRSAKAVDVHAVPPADDSNHENIYRTKEMADLLETWGEGNAWHELRFLFAPLSGKVLDIACGTGKNMRDLMELGRFDVHGCDISDMLIQRAIEKGVRKDNLCVCNATSMPYCDRAFDYSYSIGSLEHFKDGEAFIREASRVTRVGTFHQIPTSRDGQDHGWISPYQSYYNNFVAWWLRKFEKEFSSVLVLRFLWEDANSIGNWFLCFK
jgi:ubiquinone/menaquinone biosynthesis C-methylase UbiE